jgi:hypothetical protein
VTASQAPRAIYPPLELGLGWVKFVPTHVGKQVSGIGLVSPMRVIYFFGRLEFLQMDSSGWCVAISVPDVQPSHIMTLAHRRLAPPTPTSVLYIILGVSTVHPPFLPLFQLCFHFFRSLLRRFCAVLMLFPSFLTILGLSLPSAFAQQPGSFDVVGNTLVSAMMVCH